jgi:hypothetical protein
MKQIILFYLLAFCPVMAQSIKPDTIDLMNRQDILVFEFKSDNIHFVDEYKLSKEAFPVPHEIYKYDNYIILRNGWMSAFGTSYIEKHFVFIQGTDTMKIIINCGQESDLYFKNIEFKKGNYKMWIGNKYNQDTLLKGEDITSDEYLNNLVFKNAYIKKKNVRAYFGDIHFKEILFYKIDIEKRKDIIFYKVDLLDMVEKSN